MFNVHIVLSAQCLPHLLEDNCVTWVSQPQQPAIDIDIDDNEEEEDDDDDDDDDDDGGPGGGYGETCKGD